jgi:Uma2 family endonuclease
MVSGWLGPWKTAAFMVGDPPSGRIAQRGDSIPCELRVWGLDAKGFGLAAYTCCMTSVVVPKQLPFDNGDVMSREEFHRLYSECEDLEHVELIEGVVYLPSPTRSQGHADEQSLILEWLFVYRGETPGLKVSTPASVLLDDVNEPEPDGMLIRDDEAVYEDGYLASAPELIVEIAGSSAARDLHQKKRAYERNGVREYIVWRTRDEAIDWFRLVDGKYVRVQPDGKGVIESTGTCQTARALPKSWWDAGATRWQWQSADAHR